MANTYTRDWASIQPGCIIFLLDQSGSMADKFGQMQAGRDRRKCDVVATILNSFLNELVATNSLPRPDGLLDVRPRAEICVLGKEWRLLQRAVFVIDCHERVVYAEYVADQMCEPNYSAALQAIRQAYFPTPG